MSEPYRTPDYKALYEKTELQLAGTEELYMDLLEAQRENSLRKRFFKWISKEWKQMVPLAVLVLMAATGIGAVVYDEFNGPSVKDCEIAFQENHIECLEDSVRSNLSHDECYCRIGTKGSVIVRP